MGEEIEKVKQNLRHLPEEYLINKTEAPSFESQQLKAFQESPYDSGKRNFGQKPVIPGPKPLNFVEMKVPLHSVMPSNEPPHLIRNIPIISDAIALPELENIQNKNLVTVETPLAAPSIVKSVEMGWKKPEPEAASGTNFQNSNFEAPMELSEEENEPENASDFLIFPSGEKWRQIRELFDDINEDIATSVDPVNAKSIMEKIAAINSGIGIENLVSARDNVLDFSILADEELSAKILSIFKRLSDEILKFQTGNKKFALLQSGVNCKIVLNDSEILGLIGLAFFNLIPERGPTLPSFNFIRLFTNDGPRKNSKVEKIKCILSYFEQMLGKSPKTPRQIIFERRILTESEFPDWENSNSRLINMIIEDQLEDRIKEDVLRVDFANRIVGGGVLGGGSVMEEILFSTFPEMISARAFTPELGHHEVLFMRGVQKFCKYSGYAESFRFEGPLAIKFQAQTSDFVAMDALHYPKDRPNVQFKQGNIVRELIKSYCAFKKDENGKVKEIATGNWGCGIFNGDPNLKFLIQLMAASQAGQGRLRYNTFGNTSQASSFSSIYKFLQERNIVVGQLFKICVLFYTDPEIVKQKRNIGIFDYIERSIEGNLNTPQRNHPIHPQEGSNIQIAQISSKADEFLKMTNSAWKILPNGGIRNIIQKYVENSTTKYHLKLGHIFSLENILSPSNSLENHHPMMLFAECNKNALNWIISAPPGKKMVFFDRIHPLMENHEKFVLICQVALGKTYKSPYGFDHWKRCPPPPGSDSVKGCGKYIPDWAGNSYFENGGPIIPCGPTKKDTKFPHYNIHFNEYIMFDLNRVRIAFILEFKD